MFISPLLALAVNFGTFFQLKHINKKNVNIKRDKEEKKLLVTLTVQAIYPCLCFLPTVVVGTYVAATHQNLFIYWRFLDLIQYSTFGTTVPLSVIFIKEIRYMILCDLHLMTKTPSNNTNVSSRKVRLTKTDP
uniref:G_PROTEIN_RECEP_F1_2 domain-containing protein n=1 Tax=Rhabditophanes sp. KR3021 TaxID=114890 RepID=A0AC35U948_9BILA